MEDRVPAWVAGRLTPVGKLEAHRRGLRHKAVSVFVLAGDAVLLQQRAAGKYHTPGLWANSCCTHPLWGEDAGACAQRRLAQELGITGVTPVWRHQAEYRAEVGGGLIEHEVVEIFTVEASRALAVRPNPEEVQAVRWLSRPALEQEIASTPQRYTPWMRIYMAEHAAAIFAGRPGR